MPTKPSKTVETFDNPNPERDYLIQIVMPEFTCLCPKTGQPDFATLYLEYIAERKCLELKSLKQYIWSYRNEGAFHEAVTNTILSDLVAAADPRYMQLRAEFFVRGGIYTTVTAEHRQAETNKITPITPTPPERALTRPPLPGTPEAPRKPTNTGNARFRMLARAKPPAESPAATPPGPAAVAASEVEAEPEPTPLKPSDAIYVGIDVGSSACRAVAIDGTGKQLAQASAPIPLPNNKDGHVTQDPMVWWKAVIACVQTLNKSIDAERVRALAVDATSGTLLLCDKKGAPTMPALMYNDSRAQAQAEQIGAIAERTSGAHGATSGLAKLLWLSNKQLDKKAVYCLHQADWIVGKLSGVWGVSDYNNALKLGFDAEHRQWPPWLAQLPLDTDLLPKIYVPGEPIGTLTKDTAALFNYGIDTQVVAGTTDSVAAVIAAGAIAVGQAVTSLGSTLVLKLISDKPVFSPEHGVYSHRLGEQWLVGGASNVGGAALLQYFKLEQLQEMTPLLEPEKPTGLQYYPLPAMGERFPIYDPTMMPVLEPLPGDSITFFQGMLEGIARVEAQGYRLLAKLGAPEVKQVFTSGGGAQNVAWQKIRGRILGVELKPPLSRQAAYGSALIAAGLHAAKVRKSA